MRFVCLVVIAGALCGVGVFGAGAALAQNPMLPNPMLPNPMLPNPMLPNPMAPGGQAAPQTGAQEVPRNRELGNLPDTPGVEDTFYLCTACHSAQTFAQQSLTDARWDYLWDWMIETQNMPDYGPQARETILAYLKRHFSSER